MANDNRAPRYKAKELTTAQRAAAARRAKAADQYGGEAWGGSAGTPPGKGPPSSRARVSGRYPAGAHRNVAHG